MWAARNLVFLVASITPLPAAAQPVQERALPTVATHDNLQPAGTLNDGELRLSLRAGAGLWSRGADAAGALRVEALGEEGGPLTIPSPLVRVRAGTRVHASIRNTLGVPLRIHGFCDRPGPCEPLTIPDGERRDVRFTLNTEGTFHYWGGTVGPTLTTRMGADSQLGGAIIVDPPGAEVHDRVLVMGLMQQGSGPSATELTVVNGRSWPHTERLQYTAGETVRWRVVNLTAVPHAMHLHGFYFQVGSTGDGLRDTRYAEAERRLAVTEQMPPGQTITMSWVPERTGNWLFHCHMLVHMAPHEPQHGQHGMAAAPHASEPGAAGMAGLVLGVQVTGADRVPPPADLPRRELRLLVQSDTRHGSTPSYAVDLEGDGHPAPRLNNLRVPGPVMVLTRGEPVAVEVMNRLNEPTAIHWHGIELDSYDDGVPGFGGTPGSVTPPVAAGGTFTARFTPPRAGTFIYHTHWHNAAQLAAGIYGPLLVLEPGTTYDPATDHVVVLGLDGAYRQIPDEPFAVNGERKPGAMVLRANVPNRLRFINITADNVALTVQLVSRFDPIQWTLVAKDGADTPQAQRTARPARQLVAVGETYDFGLAPLPPTPVGLWMELRRGNGELVFQWPVRVQ